MNEFEKSTEAKQYAQTRFDVKPSAKVQSVFSAMPAMVFSVLFILLVGFVPANELYRFSLWIGGNLTYGTDLLQAISKFNAGNMAESEGLIERAELKAKNYRLAISPDAANDLATREENLADTALNNPSSYARAAFLYGHAMTVRSDVLTVSRPWIWLYFYPLHKEATFETRIKSARAFNLVKKPNIAKPLLLSIAKDLKEREPNTEQDQYIVLAAVEMTDVYQQMNSQNLADQVAERILERCKETNISPTTLKETAVRFKEIGREKDALAIYSEMENKHFDENDASY